LIRQSAAQLFSATSADPSLPQNSHTQFAPPPPPPSHHQYPTRRRSSSDKQAILLLQQQQQQQQQQYREVDAIDSLPSPFMGDETLNDNNLAGGMHGNNPKRRSNSRVFFADGEVNISPEPPMGMDSSDNPQAKNNGSEAYERDENNYQYYGALQQVFQAVPVNSGSNNAHPIGSSPSDSTNTSRSSIPFTTGSPPYPINSPPTIYPSSFPTPIGRIRSHQSSQGQGVGTYLGKPRTVTRSNEVGKEDSLKMASSAVSPEIAKLLKMGKTSGGIPVTSIDLGVTKKLHLHN